MRTSAIFAFFMAMFAMLCTFATADASLEKRAPVHVATAGDSFSASVDVLLKAHEKILAKIFADVCADLDLDASIDAHLNVRFQVLGGHLIDIKAAKNLKAKNELAVRAKIKAEIKAQIEAEIKAEISLHLKAQIEKVIVKKCGKTPTAACIKTNVKFIVKESAKLCVKASASIKAKIEVKLQAKIEAAIQAAIKSFFSLKFLGISILEWKVEGGAKVSGEIAAKFKAVVVVDVCAKLLKEVEVKLVTEVKSVCK